MPTPLFIRSLCMFMAVSFVPVHAETLSPQGSVLENINVLPDQRDFSLEKTIDSSGIEVAKSHMLVRLKTGEIFQKQADGNFSLFQSVADLSDAGLTPVQDALTFNVASGQFLHLLDYPLVVYLGITDTQGQLHYGSFALTANLSPLETWTETAVRKVLHTFAYGGFASDAQIQTWAAMKPREAVKEILDLNPVHAKFSPADSSDALASLPFDITQGQESLSIDGGLQGLSQFWSSAESNNPIASDAQENYSLEHHNGAEGVWRQATNLRGLNPVRQRLGFWETNYHFAVNLDADVGITNAQMAAYYDAINTAQVDKPYQEVASVAALSAAVATQYNHRRNTFDNDSGMFRGNEDFAREYHQLFFGILGTGAEEYHEEISIKNTAKALTDMPIAMENEELGSTIEFGAEAHHQGDLEILGLPISGSTAAEKIQALSVSAIQHPESLSNLPIIIARGLADDNLSEAKIKVLQNTWASMAEPNLLGFLQTYASSSLFHSSDRVKYHGVIDRYMLVLNQLTLNNDESYRDIYDLDGYRAADAQVFRPLHDVFGGQTGAEAADSAEVFRAVYNRSTEKAHVNRRSVLSDNGDVVWEKDWGSVIPAESRSVAQVLDWLWQRFNADGLKHLGDLERFHLAALLATGQDAGYAINPDDADRVFSSAEIASDSALQTALQGWLATAVPLADTDEKVRQDANAAIGQAVNFLNAIPFIFAQEGA